MKIRDVVKMIQADGWWLHHMNGSHRIFYHPTKPGIVVVPGHPGDDVAVELSKASKKTGRSTIMENPTYTVLAEQTAEGTWSAHVPDLPTILIVAKSLDELKANAREAIAVFVEEMHTLGQPIPRPSAHALSVEVAA